MTADWNLPDWKTPSLYPHELTIPEWRWQFLRRWESYRDWWLTIPDSEKTHSKAWYPAKECVVALIDDCPWGLAPMIAIDPRWETPPYQWLLPNFGQDIVCPSGVGGIEELISPAKRESQNLVVPIDTIGSLIDLRQPIPPQIKVIERTARIAQDRLKTLGTTVTKQKSRKLGVYPRHLRVLDALETGVSYRDIGMALGNSADRDQARMAGADMVRKAKTIQKTEIVLAQR